MNIQLIRVLKDNIGKPLTSDLATDIYVLSKQMPTVVPQDAIDKIRSAEYQGFKFSVEKMEHILEEIKPLHIAHWNETESHRHGLTFNPDYPTFFRYERAGRAILFTLRKEGRLLGNFSVYVSQSMHSQTLLSQEDTLFLMPEARTGRTAMRFIAYGEDALKQIGVREMNVSVKKVNKAGRFFKMIGYKHVEDGLIKVLEVEHV